MKNNNSQKTLNKIFACSIIMIIVLILNTVLLISNQSSLKTEKYSSSSENESEETNSEYDISAFKEIEAKEIGSKTKGENTVIYIGRSTCSWCVKFVPVLTEATQTYKLNTLYIDIAKIINFNSGGISNQESYDIITKLETSKGLENYMEENFGATPMLLIVKDGKIVDAQTGYTELESLNSFLEKNGF